MAAAEGTSGGGELHLRTSSIGLLDVVFQSITYMAPGIGLAFSIGIGIGFAGNALPLSVAIALLGCTCTAVAIGQTAKFIPSAGGIYTYAARGIGPASGFYVGWLYLGFAAFLPPFVIMLNGYIIDQTLKQQGWWTGSPGWEFWTAITIVVLFMLTYFDIRLSAKTGVILGIIEITVMVLLSATIIGSSSSHNSIKPFEPSSSLEHTKGLMLGAIFGILAFIGFEAASALGEEARDPRRTVPRGVLYACIGIGIYYVYCTYAWAVGAPAGGSKDCPATGVNIVDFHCVTAANDWITFAHLHWHSLWWIVFLAFINSNIACGSAAVNNTARVLFAMGRAGSLPAFIGKVHPHHRTPYVGVIVTLVLSTITSYLAGEHWGVVLGYSILGGAFTIFAIVIYMLACVACINYFTRKEEGKPHLNILLHIAIPALGIIVFLAALYGQYFSFDQFFKPAFTSFPLNWIGWGALVWLVGGVIVTLIMRSSRPEALERAAHTFGGESDELAHDGPPESMSLSH
jgi:amino acid transporter